jgi:hypothetical protein
MSTQYLSEFEQEFEMDDETSDQSETSDQQETDGEYSYEVNAEYERGDDPGNELENDEEFELDNELEADDELEAEDEFETDDEFESDDELEQDDELETDYAAWSRSGYYDRDREFETRLYRAIRSNADNELATELELDNVLHEMEEDYFFGVAKKWLKKKAKRFGAGALKAVSAVGRSKIRSLLKNKLLQTAAGFIPGAGPLVSKAMSVAGNVMSTADAAKQKIQDIVQVGKDAYQDLAAAVPEAQDEFEVTTAAKDALRKAIHNRPQTRDHRIHRRRSGANLSRKGAPRFTRNRTKRVFPLPPNARVAVFPTKVTVNKRQQVIPLKPNSIVIVKTGRLFVWEPR